MKPLYIIHHLGLGDHIICNGLVRVLAAQYDIDMACKQKNLASVRFMFRDLSNVKARPIEPQTEEEYIASIPTPSFKIGYRGKDWDEHSGQFDEAFYKQAGINFNKRWAWFHIPRDPGRENAVLDYYKVMPGSYAFVHDDWGRGLKINTDLTIDRVSPARGLTENIFDYCALMEYAAEVHCIDSSFLHIAESIPMNGKLFYHKSVRGSEGFAAPTLRKRWMEI
jgi:hypothetical protein